MSSPEPEACWAAYPWAVALQEAAGRVTAADLTQMQAPGSGPAPRQAAVLMLFAPGIDGQGEVLLTERSHGMRSHPGQVSFPGGSADPGDQGPVGTALREAQEEVGLDPSGVRVMGLLPQLYLPPSHFAVTPVLGWWQDASPVWAVDPLEVEQVTMAPLPELLDPANRFSTRLSFGYVGPGFDVSGLFVWGFTGSLLGRLLKAAGLERPWDDTMVRPVPGFS